MLIAFNNTANLTDLALGPDLPTSPYSLAQKIVIAIIASVLSVLTVVGNSLVMISFKIDKQLQTISNYFLFSLAVADFAVGLISMPLFTMFTIYGYWPLGPHVCDTWLALDYLASNASVLNLLIISFDRYFSVTRPLTYRAKRTTRRATVMIGGAWGFSLLLWPPWIYAWPYIDGERKVPPNECYIQFIETNQFITFGTAIAAFYVPVTVMCILYYKIWRETKKRQKDLPNLQGGKKHDSSKRSNSSDETREIDARARSESGDVDSVYHVRGALDPRWRDFQSGKCQSRLRGWAAVRSWCVAWWHSGREDVEDTEPEEEPSDLGYATPVSVETPLQSTVSRCTSLNVIRDPFAGRGGSGGSNADGGGTSPLRRTFEAPAIPSARDSRSLPPNTRINTATSPAPKSASADSVYTIVIRLPDADTERPSIKMITEESPPTNARVYRPPARGDSELNLHPAGHAGLSRRTSHIQDVRIPLNAKIIPKQLAGKGITTKQPKKKKTQEKKQETKAAKTLSAILLSFIITWTPYNILVLLKPLTACAKCIPDELWSFFYALCYINSTINPVCYALCNATFRRTYVRILTCKWHNRNREAMTRGVYN
ncbi:muscarinic acetylcholine receptor DM1 [Pieris brassicae]|uniref:muscarinic acetylcholine receptor DM1 n=1 Tax=Pieris brassicae TaxID=7116 RepID=UPI001E66023A|nr:muscarinic acetylcholine receptor DM1 [Pieris brassicae]XP_045522741.1 muscarinic acetylcholine receptor DM1 [Pieris brassicae]